MYKKSLVFAAAASGMLLFGISLITLGSVATDLKARFALNAIDTGTLFSILPVGILCGSFLFGPVCDRYGYKALLVLACLAMFAGVEGIAFASTLGVLKTSTFFFGTGAGIVNGATNALVADISSSHKGANLSLLGIFFGLGALGMPLVLGALPATVSALDVVGATGFLTLLVGIYCLLIRFPPPKQPVQRERANWSALFRPFLLLTSFFLFFQSALEAIINNWTTTFLVDRGVMDESRALYALSLHIVGMVLMRLVTGSVLRAVSQVAVMWFSLLMLFAGILLMQLGHNELAVIAGLILSGAGLAGGFPLMLGFISERYVALSATAFSFAFTIALVGNMSINYLMGIIVHHHGVSHLATVSYIITGLMALLYFFIIRTLNHKTH